MARSRFGVLTERSLPKTLSAKCVLPVNEVRMTGQWYLRLSFVIKILYKHKTFLTSACLSLSIYNFNN